MKHTIRMLIAATVLAAQTPALADEREAVSSAFAQWRTALAARHPEPIVRLYAKDAILLATLAAKPLITQQQRLEYFTQLMARPKLRATVDEEHITLLDEDTAVVSGLYTFQFEDGKKTVRIPARYSFVYEKDNDQWLIVGHHSSRVPDQQ